MSENKPSYSISPLTKLVDRFMDLFIRIGGVGIILAVVGMLFFILWQALPLLKDAEISKEVSITAKAQQYRGLALDEWAQLPVLVGEKSLTFFRRQNQRKAKVLI